TKVRFARSVSEVALPMEKSRFQKPSPRATPRWVRPSTLNRNGRKLLKAASGLAKRLSPVPPAAGLAVVPTPPEPATPECTPPLSASPPLVGALSVVEPKIAGEPKMSPPCVTGMGSPVRAIKMKDVYQPDVSLLPLGKGRS